jgi:hypothetical protein
MIHFFLEVLRAPWLFCKSKDQFGAKESSMTKCLGIDLLPIKVFSDQVGW